MIRVEQKMERYPNFGTDLLNPDFARYAEACGTTGIRMDGPEEVVRHWGPPGIPRGPCCWT